MFKSQLAKATAVALTVIVAAPTNVMAQERYIGEIFMGGWNFCPRGSAEAAGQLLAISSNTALFSLFGTQYGGDGRTTFGLPDLRGRVPMNAGTGPGLSPRTQGASGGSETNTLTVAQLPPHSHQLRASTQRASSGGPSGLILADTGRDDIYASSSSSLTAMSGQAIGNTGSGQAVNNMQPFLVIKYCVATVGIFPSRS